MSNYVNIACALNSALITVLGNICGIFIIFLLAIEYTGMYANPIVSLLFI